MSSAIQVATGAIGAIVSAVLGGIGFAIGRVLNRGDTRTALDQSQTVTLSLHTRDLAEIERRLGLVERRTGANHDEVVSLGAIVEAHERWHAEERHRAS